MDSRTAHLTLQMAASAAGEIALCSSEALRKNFCPGHGVAFSLADGTSRCAAFTLRAIAVVARDGKIILQRHRASTADAVRANTAAE